MGRQIESANRRDRAIRIGSADDEAQEVAFTYAAVGQSADYRRPICIIDRNRDVQRVGQVAVAANEPHTIAAALIIIGIKCK